MINFPTINFHDAIGYAHVELALDDAFHVYAVSDQLVLRCHLPGKFDFAGTQCTTAPRAACPSRCRENGYSEWKSGRIILKISNFPFQDFFLQFVELLLR